MSRTNLKLFAWIGLLMLCMGVISLVGGIVKLDPLLLFWSVICFLVARGIRRDVERRSSPTVSAPSK